MKYKVKYMDNETEIIEADEMNGYVPFTGLIFFENRIPLTNDKYKEVVKYVSLANVKSFEEIG